jgi:predicted nucleic acid-binding protein
VGTVGVVFETNVLVSALGFGGTPLDAVLRGFQEDVDLLLSEATLAELERVMT